jgi:hypothetical protein
MQLSGNASFKVSSVFLPVYLEGGREGRVEYLRQRSLAEEKCEPAAQVQQLLLLGTEAAAALLQLPRQPVHQRVQAVPQRVLQQQAQHRSVIGVGGQRQAVSIHHITPLTGRKSASEVMR